MDRASIHRGFISHLLGLRDEEKLVRQVRLAARLYNDEWVGGAEVSNTYVFIPDLHLTSKRTERDFQYGFRKIRSGRTVARDTLLAALGRRLGDFRAAFPASQNLNVVVLGDFLDLWRERPQPGEDVTSMVRRILEDYPELEDLFVSQGTKSLLPWPLLGNHELWEQQGLLNSNLLPQIAKSQLLPLGERDTVLATHGHWFDPLEMSLADNLQEFFVERFGPLVSGNTYQLDRRVGAGKPTPESGPRGDPSVVLQNIDHAETLADWVNLWVTHQGASPKQLAKSHGYLKSALQSAAALRQGETKILGLLGLEAFGALPALRTVVIGHSHHTRLSLHIDTADPSRSLVLVDCGAWIESCRFGSSKAAPSCQVGFLCGGDVRIYQLDPA